MTNLSDKEISIIWDDVLKEYFGTSKEKRIIKIKKKTKGFFAIIILLLILACPIVAFIKLMSL